MRLLGILSSAWDVVRKIKMIIPWTKTQLTKEKKLILAWGVQRSKYFNHKSPASQGNNTLWATHCLSTLAPLYMHLTLEVLNMHSVVLMCWWKQGVSKAFFWHIVFRVISCADTSQRWQGFDRKFPNVIHFRGGTLVLYFFRKHKYSWQWRHIECNGVSIHRHLDCLLSRLFRPISKKTSKLCVNGLCAGNLPFLVSHEVVFLRTRNSQ